MKINTTQFLCFSHYSNPLNDKMKRDAAQKAYSEDAQKRDG